MQGTVKGTWTWDKVRSDINPATQNEDKQDGDVEFALLIDVRHDMSSHRELRTDSSQTGESELQTPPMTPEAAIARDSSADSLEPAWNVAREERQARKASEQLARKGKKGDKATKHSKTATAEPRLERRDSEQYSKLVSLQKGPDTIPVICALPQSAKTEVKQGSETEIKPVDTTEPEPHGSDEGPKTLVWQTAEAQYFRSKCGKTVALTTREPTLKVTPTELAPQPRLSTLAESKPQQEVDRPTDLARSVLLPTDALQTISSSTSPSSSPSPSLRSPPKTSPLLSCPSCSSNHGIFIAPAGNTHPITDTQYTVMLDTLVEAGTKGELTLEVGDAIVKRFMCGKMSYATALKDVCCGQEGAFSAVMLMVLGALAVGVRG